MASGYSLVFGWLAFWVLRRSVWASVDSPESSVRELPHSEGCPYTYIGTVFLILGWVFRFSGFFFLSFGILDNLQLGDSGFWGSF